jgi:UDP-glucose 4-epimerase
MKVLVTGGAGYIGSHTTVELLQEGHDVVIADNTSNSSEKVIDRITKITNKAPLFVQCDITDSSVVEKLFSDHHFDAVIHFAAFKAVGESVAKPLAYYRNNLLGLLTVLESAQQHSTAHIVFSSSATVYGNPEEVPLTEESRTGVGITNPYGQTKYMCEQILHDFAVAHPKTAVTILRYFNPVGAHESGLIGEDPSGTPNNLMPYITQVATKKLKELQVFGDDYPTKDGTGVRDYIHVVDLAKGHLAALKNRPEQSEPAIYNLGTGIGYSVLEIIQTFESVTGAQVPYTIAPRRAGDIAECYSDASKAAKELHWKTEKTLIQMCEDAWRWQSKNPDGYA